MTTNRQLAVWLLAVSALIVVLVAYGGWVRLTRSGLSIVEWNVVTGVVPPLSAAAWESEFAKYRQTPEYQLVNYGMELDAFKFIYYMEFGHRLLGRLAGLLFVVPLLYFLCRRAIPRAHIPAYLGIGLLFALQGLVGWLMVKSGLDDRPQVSHLRLTLHLSCALALLAACLWQALGYLSSAAGAQPVPRTARRLCILAICRHLSPNRRWRPSRRAQGRTPIGYLPQNVRGLGSGRLVVYAAAAGKPARQPHHRPLPTPLLRLCSPRTSTSTVGGYPPHSPATWGRSNPLLGSGANRLGDRHGRRACALGLGLAASGSSRGPVRCRAFPLPPRVQKLDHLIAVDDLGFDRAVGRNSAHCKRDPMLRV